MTVRFYQSSDASAPVLNDTQGSLLAVLVAILVNGYGTQTAAGWTIKATGGTGQKTLQQGGGNGFFLQIDDSAATGAAAYARAIGAEGATTTFGSANLTNLFPTTAQLSAGVFWARCNTTTSPSRWACIADNARFYFWNENDGTSNGATNVQQLFFFGDLDSYKSADAFATRIGGQTSATTVNTAVTGLQASIGTNNTGIWTCRRFDQTSTSIASGIHTDYVKSGQAAALGGTVTGSLAYPNPEDGALYLTPVWSHESAVGGNSVRGLVPGIWNPCQAQSNYNSFDTSTGSTGLTGKSFSLFRIGTTNGVAFETSNTWS